MTESPSFLDNWIDSDFWNLGAFLTMPDDENVILGKGGEIAPTDSIQSGLSPAFYLKDFFENNYLAYRPSHFIQISKKNILNWIKELSESHKKISPISNDDDSYEKDFSLLKSSFGERLEKVVLTSRETYLPYEGTPTIKRLIKRSFNFNSGLPYGLWNKNFGMIGSTPEILYHIKGEELKTWALAGTAKKGLEEELLNSKKDRHEHDLVIKDITEKMTPFVSAFEVKETQIHPFKNLVHLRTNIEGKVKQQIDFTLLTNTFSPTAALGGYPKAEALSFLKGSHYFQKYPQRYFGSAFGVIDKNEASFVVAIRNVQWMDHELFIESGGGVVSESEFKKELEEIHLKRNTIRSHYL